MKSKFFGLKMAVAVLAVGATFTSCYDSNQGDIFIPDAVEFPDPVYVVNGTVINFSNQAALDGVDVSGAVTATTVGGYFEAKNTNPFSGAVNFAKEGFYPATRSVNQSTLTAGQGTLVSILNVAMFAEGVLPEAPTIEPADPENPGGEEVATMSKTGTPSGDKFANNTDSPIRVTFNPLRDLNMRLDAGAQIPAEAVDTKTLIKDILKATYGNDPYGAWGVFDGDLTVEIPARTQLTKIVITPIVAARVLKFVDFEGNEVVQNFFAIVGYAINPTFESIEHIHGHTHGPNGGGGIGE